VPAAARSTHARTSSLPSSCVLRRHVRLRIGIHTGRPTLTDAGYVGLAVHTVARIGAAGHGGQILLSAAARDAVGRARPTGIRLRSLGSHRFRGLREAHEIFQVQGPDLQARFAPLRSLAAVEGAPDASAKEATRPE